MNITLGKETLSVEERITAETTSRGLSQIVFEGGIKTPEQARILMKAKVEAWKREFKDSPKFDPSQYEAIIENPRSMAGQARAFAIQWANSMYNEVDTPDPNARNNSEQWNRVAELLDPTNANLE